MFFKMYNPDTTEIEQASQYRTCENDIQNGY